MKHIIRLTDSEKESIKEQAKANELSKLSVKDDLICDAIISSFYQQKFITESECAMIRNQLSSGNGISA